MELVLENVDRIVGQEIHLKDIHLTFASGSRYVILGRTLAGKTSLLRVIAGLDPPTRGRVLMDGQDVTGVSVRKRSIAMVYQQFVNYPSLTVYKNIASPLKVAGADPDEIDRRVRHTAEMLRIDPFLDRLPAELSGGQQQRTAIARALVKETDLLLLDEPLVNLDYKLREELRIELQDIFERRSAIVIYTTTEPTEALMLGGNTIVMDEGRVLQEGPTPHVYHHPASVKVAEVFSDPPVNFITASVEEGKAGIGGNIRFSLPGHMKQLDAGEYLFGIRPNHLYVKSRSDQDIRIQGKVELAEINGSETFVHTRFEEASLVVQEEGVFNYKIGSPISIFAHPDRFYVYDASRRLVAAPQNTAA